MPPRAPTLEGWAKQMPAGFEFTLKAWQLITHEASSPTHRRLTKPLSEKDSASAGSFRWSDVVRNAWQTTLESAQALSARTVLFQCPAAFKPTKLNIRRMTKFFSAIERGGLNFAWEPRGPEWTDETIAQICGDLDLWHAVDPFSRQSMTPERCYFRLHGGVRWRYSYDPIELEELATLIPDDRLGYVFFNNISMLEDALVFQDILRKVVKESSSST